MAISMRRFTNCSRASSIASPRSFFWNRGASRGMGFVPVPPEKCGNDIFKPIVARGSAFADIDGMAIST